MEQRAATLCWLRQVCILHHPACHRDHRDHCDHLAGVFSADGRHIVSLDHSPRDFLPVENSYQEPAFTTAHVLEAVQTIFKKEQWVGE